jgi:hypothetical protein
VHKKLSSIKSKTPNLRLSNPLITSDSKYKDFEFPKEVDLSYENYIVGFVHKPGTPGLNFIMSDDTRSNLPEDNFSGGVDVFLTNLSAAVHRVVIYGAQDTEVGGVRFFDKEGN